MSRRIILTLAPLVLAAGCATHPPYTCRLGETDPSCHNMQEVYGTAHNTSGKQAVGLENIMRPDPAHPVPPPPPPLPVANHGKDYVEPGEVGRPVFREPTVHRVWIAPYIDADGNLRSGEYTYFSTPGEWNYGSTTAAGSASASTMFAPVKPDQNNLGFKPVVKPAAPSQSPPRPGDASNAGSLAPAPASNITLPAQKLTE